MNNSFKNENWKHNRETFLQMSKKKKINKFLRVLEFLKNNKQYKLTATGIKLKERGEKNE